MLGPSIDSFEDGLPKELHILKRYYSFGRNLTDAQKISQLLSEIKTVYENAGITTVHPENIRHKLKSLITSAKSIISTRKSPNENQVQREIEFRRKVDSVFAVASGSDVVGSLVTDLEDEMLSQNSHDESMDGEMIQNESDDELYQADDNTIEDFFFEEYEPPKKKQKITNNVLEKINAECSQNASFRVMSSFIKIGIEIAGGSPNEYCVSKSQLHNQLLKFRSKEKDNAIEKLTSSNSKLLLLFDTKTCSKLNKRHLGSKLRLVIILRDEIQEITLGPYTLSNHGAEAIASKIIEVIEIYNLHNRIVGIVCDTENTNTGYLTGVCVRLEEFLERDLLYFMCRHHIYDLVLKHIAEFLFGHSTAPTFDFGCCTELKRMWENLNTAAFTPYNEGDDEMEPEEDIFRNFRQSAVQTLKNQTKEHSKRDDYAELTDLALKFFGESTIETKGFMVPGAVNNSRWMARAIYILKCFLFRYQLDFDEELLDRLRRFSLFVSTIYVKYWNWSTSVFNAPINDLRFLKEIEKYRGIDRELANIAIEAFSRHLTYLSDEMIALSLFSYQLDNDEREEIRLRFNRTVQARTENSIRYIFNDDNFSSLELNDFVTQRSGFLLSTFDVDISFMEYDTLEWHNMQSYQQAREKLKNLLVTVNDSAERALGQTANMINYQKARNENNLQNLLTCKLSKKQIVNQS